MGDADKAGEYYGSWYGKSQTRDGREYGGSSSERGHAGHGQSGQDHYGEGYYDSHYKDNYGYSHYGYGDKNQDYRGYYDGYEASGYGSFDQPAQPAFSGQRPRLTSNIPDAQSINPVETPAFRATQKPALLPNPGVPYASKSGSMGAPVPQSTMTSHSYAKQMQQQHLRDDYDDEVQHPSVHQDEFTSGLDNFDAHSYPNQHPDIHQPRIHGMRPQHPHGKVLLPTPPGPILAAQSRIKFSGAALSGPSAPRVMVHGPRLRQASNAQSSAPPEIKSQSSTIAESSHTEVEVGRTGTAHCNMTGVKMKENSVEATEKVETDKNEEEEDDDDDDEEEDINYCKVCNVRFEKEQAYHVHIRSTSHHQAMVAYKRPKKIEDAKKPVAVATPSSEPVKRDDHFCHVCNFPFSNAEVFNSHLQGLLHLRRLEEQKKTNKSEAAAAAAVDEGEDSQDSSEDKDISLGWVAAGEKYLSMDDTEKSGSSQYHCDTCNIGCTGLKSFEMHVAGSKHAKKLKQAKEIEEFERKKRGGELLKEDDPKIKKKRKVLRVQEILDQCSEPLIGLDYMTEFQLENSNIEPRYICDLCQCRMDMRQVLAHLTGVKHRHKYFKYHSIREFNILWDIRKKSEKVKVATKFAAETEAREGRHRMRLRIQMHPLGGDRDTSLEGWEEVEDAHSRPKYALPGLATFEDHMSKYKEVDEDDDDPDEGPLLDVDELRRSAPPPRPPPPPPPPPQRAFPKSDSLGRALIRPRMPYGYSTEPSFPQHPRGPEFQYASRGRPPGPPRQPRITGGYLLERPSLLSDAYYGRYPTFEDRRYDPRYDPRYDHQPQVSSDLKSRAVINYDHQRLTNDEVGHDGKDSGMGSRFKPESSVLDRYESMLAKYRDRRPTEEKSQHSTVSSSPLNIEVIKAAITQCDINTESDAEIALQISNSLTQALLEYRLSSLAKVGSSDPNLEQHLKNLREQNAEMMNSGTRSETSQLMCKALKATQALAVKLSEGDQEMINQAMSVLDAVNLHLYGMLDKTEDAPKPAPKKKDHEQKGSNNRGDEKPGPSGASKSEGTSGTARPTPSKRFRFGL